MDTGTFTIELAQRADYCFETRFDNPTLPVLVEPLRRVLDQFEDFCIVTQSVRVGIPVDVRVLDRNEAVLKQPETAGEPA